MARAKFAGNELDRNIQIEDAVKETLRVHQEAEVSAAFIASAYDLLDKNVNVVEGTLEEKCGAIAKAANAAFAVRGETVVFRRRQA
jgi:hypothetical protein